MQNADSTPETCKLQALSVVYNDGDALLLDGKPLDKTNGFGREREARDRERKKRLHSRFSLQATPCTRLYRGEKVKSLSALANARPEAVAWTGTVCYRGGWFAMTCLVPRQDLIRQLLLPNTVCRASGTSRRRVWFYALKRKGTKAPVRIARRPYS